jgi:hypothetical protein
MRCCITVLCLMSAACGFAKPERVPDAKTDVVDAPALDAPPEGTEFTGTIVVGGGSLQVGDVAVLDDGFELWDWQCSEELCVAGGVTP